MEPARVYIALLIAGLAIMASVFVLLKKNKDTMPISWLSGLALACILAGIVFGGKYEVLGYGCIVAGALLAVVDTVRRAKRR